MPALTHEQFAKKLEEIVERIISDPGDYNTETSLRIQAYAEVLFILGWQSFTSEEEAENELWSSLIDLSPPEASIQEEEEEEICEWCYSTDHTGLYCDSFDDYTTPPPPPVEKQFLPPPPTTTNGEIYSKDGILIGYEEEYDGEFVIIPLDLFETCYNRIGLAYRCMCEPEECLKCDLCNVGREYEEHEWRPIRLDGEYDIVKRKKSKKSVVVTSPGNKPQTNALSSKWSYSYVSKDRHYGDKYTTFDNTLTLYVSSSWNNRKKDDPDKPYFIPDFGLYFDSAWKPTWRNEFIDWPDFGVPTDLFMAVEQITDAMERVREGQKVEFGCIGAHGRTGTALSIVNVLLGCEPVEAMKHVRTYHCEHAIESELQEWYVKWVHAKINNLEVPEKPVIKPPVYGSYKGKVGNSCSKAEHFESWASGDDKCSACQWWDDDVKEFRQGKFPTESWKGEILNYINGKYVYGYIIPNTGFSKTNIPHAPKAKLGCMCDVCRYLDAGFQAFLMPSEAKQKEIWVKTVDELEKSALSIMAQRRISGISLVKKDEHVIKVAQPNGSIIEMSADSEFMSRYPMPTWTGTEGQHDYSLCYKYYKAAGWVYVGLNKI